MPVLSMHNTYALPSGSASYTLGLSGAPNAIGASYPYSSQVGTSALDRALLSSTAGLNLIGSSAVERARDLAGLQSAIGHGGGKWCTYCVYLCHVTIFGCSAKMKITLLDSTCTLAYDEQLFIDYHFCRFIYIGYSQYTNPIHARKSYMDDLARRPCYDDLDLIVGGRYGPRPLTPTSPIPREWELGMDGVNPAFMHHQRSLSRSLGPLDLEGLY